MINYDKLGLSRATLCYLKVALVSLVRVMTRPSLSGFLHWYPATNYYIIGDPEMVLLVF